MCVSLNFKKKSLELHWMENFNEKSARKTFNEINLGWHFRLKFINNCSENLDILIFSSFGKEMEYLEIESKGPISINADVSINTIYFNSSFLHTNIILLL